MLSLYGWDTTEIATIAFAAIVACYFVGTIINGIIGPEAFGINGNMLIMAIGVFVGLYIAQYNFVPKGDEITLAFYAISGSFGTVLFMIIVKIIFRKFGM